MRRGEILTINLKYKNMTPIEVLKILQRKIDEAKFYKTNYVLQTNDIEMIAETLRNNYVVCRSEQLCGFFESDNKTSSATKCKCGREKWEHPKAT
jgi:predicted Zn-ribbon and HTH transcriptional regulator